MSEGKRQSVKLSALLYPLKRVNLVGFTLMEMLVVLAIVILLLGVSIPFFAGFSKGVKLKTAAKDLAGSLNTARSLAITQRKNYSVNFDSSAHPHSYYIEAEGAEVYGKTYYLPSAIRFYRPADPNNSITFGSSKATFTSTGGLSGSSGSVWIADQKGNFRRIVVSGATGRVKIDRQP